MTGPNSLRVSPMPAVVGWASASYDWSHPPTANVAESKRTRIAVGSSTSLNRLSKYRPLAASGERAGRTPPADAPPVELKPGDEPATRLPTAPTRDFGGDSMIVCSPNTASVPPRRTKSLIRLSCPSVQSSLGKNRISASASWRSASESFFEIRGFAPRLFR